MIQTLEQCTQVQSPLAPQTDSVAEHNVQSAPTTSRLAALKRLGAFALWILGGFGLIAALRRRRSARFKIEEISIYCLHRSFFLWALMLTGFIGAAAVRHHGSPLLWGWVYIWVLLYTLLTLLFDLSALRFALWGGIAMFVWVVSKYLEDLKHMHVLSGLTGWVRHFHPQLDAGMATILSVLLLVPWLIGLFYSFSQGRKVFSPNTIEEWFFGEGHEITDRSGLNFRSRYRDVLETALGLGSGDLEAIDGNGNVVKRYENIVCLLFVWRRLDEILHQRSAVVDNAPQDPVEIESVRTPA